ncbi:hypothetical protein [Agarivorans sp. DSG3-1]|uniref:hypothetical protein n=1 Tax=Agarivorans sp. DSG3-1 TaxID=3342249 RepID=UPI00398F4195
MQNELTASPVVKKFSSLLINTTNYSDSDLSWLGGDENTDLSSTAAEPEKDNWLSGSEILDIALMTEAQVTIRLHKLKVEPKERNIIDLLIAIGFDLAEIKPCLNSNLKLEYIYILASKRLMKEVEEEEYRKDPLRGYSSYFDEGDSAFWESKGGFDHWCKK